MTILLQVRDALEKSLTLSKLVTVKQVIQAGDDAINAAGLSPWCMNEGTATGDEHISTWRIEEALTALNQLIEAVPDGLGDALTDTHDSCMKDGGSCAAESMEALWKAATLLHNAVKGE